MTPKLTNVLHLALQKEHVQQFLATEDALNKAAEAKALSQKLLQRLHGTVDATGSKKLPTGNTSQNVTNSRHLEVHVQNVIMDDGGHIGFSLQSTPDFYAYNIPVSY